MLLRNLRPIRLSRRPEPFDSDQFIFELKIDGFRALAHIENGKGELISRNGNVFRGFADLSAWIAAHLRVESAVLDGEIACVDDSGRPVFRDLLFRRRQCVFIAFDQVCSIVGWQVIQDAAAYNRIESAIRLKRYVSHIILTEFQVMQLKSFLTKDGFLDVGFSDLNAYRASPMLREFEGKNSVQTPQVENVARPGRSRLGRYA